MNDRTTSTVTHPRPLGEAFWSAAPASLPLRAYPATTLAAAAEPAHSSVPPSKGKHSMKHDYHQKTGTQIYYKDWGQRTTCGIQPWLAAVGGMRF